MSNSISPPEGVPEHALRKFAHDLDLGFSDPETGPADLLNAGGPSGGRRLSLLSARKGAKIAEFAQKSFNGCPESAISKVSAQAVPHAPHAPHAQAATNE